MNFYDNNNYLQVLCEIIIKKDRELLNYIKDLKWSAVSKQQELAERLMEVIKTKLSEWDIDIQSFENITSKESALNTMLYLIETIQSEDYDEFEQLKYIKDILKKDIRTIDKLYDCLEVMPDLLAELQKRVTFYNTNMDKRIHIYKSLKEFACELFNFLCAVKRKRNNFQRENSKQLDEFLIEYMIQLLHMSFVISAYPPRTIKKGTDNKVGTHFKSTINCLIETEKLFSREVIQPYFLTEGDFKDYTETKQLKKDCAIKFKINNLKQNVWELNMLWIPPKRLQKDVCKTERITNKKAIILITFKAQSSPYLFASFEVNTNLFSDTVISIVHTNQEIDAFITLFWDDYFRVDRTDFLRDGGFKCKESVTIQEFTEAISRYFEKETSRGLTLSNKEFISRKLFRTAGNGLISVNQFSSQIMPDSKMSFGSWILSIIKLLKISGTSELWKHNFIDGFLSKDVDSLFSCCTPGTFALRFSEKNAKIGVLLKSQNNSLEAWNPFDADECRNRNLCERLFEFHELQLLRTADGTIVKKEDALSGFVPNKTPDEGYTERGQLSRILCSNIYSESLSMFGETDDNTMDTDPFIGLDMDEPLTP